MDQAITWAVVWGLLAFLTSGLIGCVVGSVIALIGAVVDQDWLALVGIALGWVSGIAWFIFCVVKSVESIITAVNLA